MKNKLVKVSLATLISGSTINQLVYPVWAENLEGIFTAQSQEGTPRDAPPPSATKPQIEMGEVKLEVLDEGKEPKQKIRFKVPQARQETGTLVMQMESINNIAGNPTPKLKMPTSVVEIAMKVTKVDDNGDMHVSFTYPSATVVVTDDKTSPEVVRLMRTLMPKLTEVKGEFILDERGKTKATKFSLPAGNDPVSQEFSSQISNSFNQFSFPFPEEAIGKGAKWRAINSIKVNGIEVQQVVNYKLADLREDGVAAIEMNLAQNGEPQTVRLPGLPLELAVRMKYFRTRGQGRMKLSFDRLFPISSSAALNSNTEMSVKIPGNNGELTTKVESYLNMSIRSQPPIDK